MAEIHGGRGGAQAAQPAHRVVVRGDGRSDGRGHVGARVAVVASALACISGVATWVGSTSSRTTGVRADELLAAPRFGAAKAELRAEEAAVTKQLYAAEDQDAKTGFRVAKDRALVHSLEEKAERISSQLKDPAAAVKPAREMMLARKNAFASLRTQGAPTSGAKMISLSDMGAIIKAVKEAEGETSVERGIAAAVAGAEKGVRSTPRATEQPINLNIYLPGTPAAAAAAAAPAAAPTTAQIAAQQVKQSAALRLQLKAQDEQIHQLLADAKPKQAATELSNKKIEAALSSAVSDMAAHLHAQNPIKLAAKLGVADPVALEPAKAAAGNAMPANVAKSTGSAAGSEASETAEEEAAAKAAHLKKVEEMDGLLLKGKKGHNQLRMKPSQLGKARTQELADGSAREQLATAEAREAQMRHHQQLIHAMRGVAVRARTSQLGGGSQVDHPTLDQEESNSFFPSEHERARLPMEQASKLKHSYRSQMYELDRAAGADAEHMKITGSIRDVIPDALFHAMNRQNAITDMLHPRSKSKGFPVRPSAKSVFGHSVAGRLQLPSDDDVIKENNRMLDGLESAAGFKPRSHKGRLTSGDGWGEHYHTQHDDDGWNSKRWLGDKQALQEGSDRPIDHGSIPVLSDGWGRHDHEGESKRSPASAEGLAGWKNQLKNSERALGFKGLMAQQTGSTSRHTELEDARTASRDGWLR